MNNKSILTGALVVLLVIAVGVIGWLYVSFERAQRDAAQAAQTLEAQKQADIAAKQTAALQQEQALEDQLKVTWPSRGTQLCYEHQYSISWQAPADMDAVTVVLYSPTSSTRIGDFPAVNNGTGAGIGYGSTPWDLTNAAGEVVPPSQVYKLTISGMYHDHQISTSTEGVFSIGYCK
jgi:hypothetical protein